MIITFCGHAQIYNGQKELREEILKTINKNASGEDVTFYLGGYGTFDHLALLCCKEYKQNHPNARLIFVSPYLEESYFQNRELRLREYDGIEYAEVEDTPKKFAIIKRNEWMVKQSDLLIAYVNYGWGGAAKTLLYAQKHKKNYVNLGAKIWNVD